jgi:D-methionine transport system substrate-binding protein
MKTKWGAAALVMAVFSLFLVGGCSKTEKAGKGEAKEINIACMETAQALVAEAIPLMKEKGYNAKYTMFDNNRNTLSALNDGSVDAVFVVHKPFMESFNEAAGADLVMAEPYVYTVGMGLFSDTYDRIEAIPEGATITIANDAMNMDRGLRILESTGLITLNPNVERAAVIDIIENPKNLTIIDMDQTQLVRTLESAAGTVAFFSHMKNANKDFTKYLARDKDLSAYPIGVVVKSKDKKAAWVGALVDTLRSDKLKTFAAAYYGGLYEYYE